MPDHRVGEKDWLAVKFFFSNAPQFSAIPGNGTNVQGFGADRKQNNRLISAQNIHTFGVRTVNEARIGYSFISADSFGRNPVKDSDVGINRANANAYPGLGLIRIGPAGTKALTIGNAGTNVDMQSTDSATTLIFSQSHAATGDDSLRHQVEALLSAHGKAGSFIEKPALEVEARFIAKDQTESAVGQTLGHYKIIASALRMCLDHHCSCCHSLTCSGNK